MVILLMHTNYGKYYQDSFILFMFNKDWIYIISQNIVFRMHVIVAKTLFVKQDTKAPFHILCYYIYLNFYFFLSQNN